MKTCPTCQTQYTDDTLRFCLQDGAPLTRSTSSTDAPTISFGETDTLVNPRQGRTNYDTQPDLAPDASTSNVRSQTPTTMVAVGVTALVMLVVFGVLGSAAFWYLSARPSEEPSTSNAASSDKPEPLVSKPRVEREPTPEAPVVATSPADASLDARTRADIIRQIHSWRAHTESMDLEMMMSHYAPSVDYYNRRGADLALIRSDKARAFERFESIRFELSNFAVTAEGPDEIRALFDKEWRFEGNRTSKGKVRQELRFKKMDGRWLITTERDLKVY